MGTFNYHTSDYITLAIQPYNYNDFDEEAILEDIYIANGWDKEVAQADISNYIYDLIQSYYDDDLENVEQILSRYDFTYYHLEIKGGYYEGFSLDIKNNYSVAYDDWEDRRYANKELTKLKQCLKELAGVGMAACYPFWYTKFEDYNGTLRCIDEAIKEMRAEVKTIPTWRQYNS